MDALERHLETLRKDGIPYFAYWFDGYFNDKSGCGYTLIGSYEIVDRDKPPRTRRKRKMKKRTTPARRIEKIIRTLAKEDNVRVALFLDPLTKSERDSFIAMLRERMETQNMEVNLYGIAMA